MLQCLRGWACASLVVLMSAGFASATSITTTSLQTWTTSQFITGSVTDVNVSANAFSNFTYPNATDTIGNYVFTSSTTLKGQSFFSPAMGYSETGLVGLALTVTPAAAGSNNSFALDLGVGSGACNGCLSLKLSDGTQFTGVSAGWFAFSLSNPISSFTIQTTNGANAAIGDVVYAASALPQDGGTSQTPAAEGATLIMTIGGLFVLLGAGRKLLPKAATV